jgi:hypothetical protein
MLSIVAEHREAEWEFEFTTGVILNEPPDLAKFHPEGAAGFMILCARGHLSQQGIFYLRMKIRILDSLTQ